jgi:hypothetical protein
VDVERTIEFILDCQAKAEVRMAAHDEAIARIDKQLKATANLLRGAVRLGARELRRLNEQQRLSAEQQRITDEKLAESRRITDQKFVELAESQRITDQKFQAFMQSFGKGENGN